MTVSADTDLVPLGSLGGVGPSESALPVRLGPVTDRVVRPVVGGGTEDVVVGQGDESSAPEVEPDAVGRGWVTPPGGSQVDALFVLAGSSMGIGRTPSIGAPVWLSLSDIVNLDAIGDLVDGLVQVEIVMEDGTLIGAGWTEEFCAAVVDTLQSNLEAPTADLTADPAHDPTPDTTPDEAVLPRPAAHEVLPHPAAHEVLPRAAAYETTDIPGAPDWLASSEPVGAPDVRFDEVTPSDVDRTADPVTPSEPDSSPPAFSAEPVVRSRSRRAEAGAPAQSAGANGSSTSTAPAESPPTPVPPAPPAPTSMFGMNPSSGLSSSRPTDTEGAGPAPAAPAASTESVAADSALSGSTTSDSTDGSGASTDVAAEASPSGDTTPDVRTGALELEDVVYLGGYPGHSRKRKKCTAVLTRRGVEVSGPGELQFQISWDVVNTVEAQNSDEARFRMNTKIHRDSSALVIECDQDVTILIEARDCPTIPLRSAISQLLVDLPVLVV